MRWFSSSHLSIQPRILGQSFSTKKKYMAILVDDAAPVLRISFGVTAFWAFAQGLVVNASGNTHQTKAANLTIGPGVHCTTDESWLVSPAEDLSTYDQACRGAQYLAKSELERHGLDTEFEFFDRKSRHETTKPTIPLPRKYVIGKSCMYLHPRFFSW